MRSAPSSAAGFGLVGWSCLLLPLFLARAAWVRIRPREREKVVGRELGGVLLLLTLAPMSQLVLPQLAWQGATVDSGGAWGVVLGGFLASRMNLAGAFVLLAALLLVALALLVQTSLGEVLSGWRARYADWRENRRMAAERRRERRAKERARRRVVVKHLQRAADEKQKRLEKLAGPTSWDDEDQPKRARVARVATAEAESDVERADPPAARRGAERRGRLRGASRRRGAAGECRAAGRVRIRRRTA